MTIFILFLSLAFLPDGPTNPRGHNSMVFIGATFLCPSLGLGKASAQGRCVTRISFSQRCLLFFLNISFMKGNARNLYLKLRMSVVFQPNDPSSDCVRMTGWKGNPSEASEQMIWRATCWRATPDDPCGTKIAVQVALEILEDAFWNTKKKYSGPEMSHQDFHGSLRYRDEKMQFDWSETSFNPSMTSDARLEATKALSGW